MRTDGNNDAVSPRSHPTKREEGGRWPDEIRRRLTGTGERGSGSPE
jgi:hypothetical protein